MVWDHKKVFEALLNKGNYPKSGNIDKYVSLDHHELMELNIVLYDPDSKNYKSSPLHINKGRAGYSEKLFHKISPVIQKTSRSEPEWVRYKVKDWDKFAEALGL